MMIYCYLALDFLDKRNYFIPRRDHGHADPAMRTKGKKEIIAKYLGWASLESDLYFISKLWKLIFVIGLCDVATSNKLIVNKIHLPKSFFFHTFPTFSCTLPRLNNPHPSGNSLIREKKETDCQ